MGNRKPNVNKLLELVGVFTLYPERQRQSSWFGSIEKNTTAKKLAPGSSCGTTLCTAGWTAVLYGPSNAIFSPDDGEAFFVPNPFGDYFVMKRAVMTWDDYQFAPEDKPGTICDRVDIPEFARKELGLSSKQAHALFYEAETIPEVLAVIRKIIAFPDVEGWELINEIEKVRYPED